MGGFLPALGIAAPVMGGIGNMADQAVRNQQRDARIKGFGALMNSLPNTPEWAPFKAQWEASQDIETTASAMGQLSPVFGQIAKQNQFHDFVGRLGAAKTPEERQGILAEMNAAGLKLDPTLEKSYLPQPPGKLPTGAEEFEWYSHLSPDQQQAYMQHLKEMKQETGKPVNPLTQPIGDDLTGMSPKEVQWLTRTPEGMAARYGMSRAAATAQFIKQAPEGDVLDMAQGAMGDFVKLVDAAGLTGSDASLLPDVWQMKAHGLLGAVDPKVQDVIDQVGVINQALQGMVAKKLGSKNILAIQRLVNLHMLNENDPPSVNLNRIKEWNRHPHGFFDQYRNLGSDVGDTSPAGGDDPDSIVKGYFGG